MTVEPPRADPEREGAAPFVARVFSAFGLVGTALVVLGTALTLAQGDVSAPYSLPAPGALLGDLLALRAPAVLGAGLLWLLALPLVRNAAVVFRSLRRSTPAPALLALLTSGLLVVLYLSLTLLASPS
jgi:hypothetical protein